jgi:hypothetical protein
VLIVLTVPCAFIVPAALLASSCSVMYITAEHQHVELLIGSGGIQLQIIFQQMEDTMSIIRIIALSLALMFVTTVGITAFAPQAHAGTPCCSKHGR